MEKIIKIKVLKCNEGYYKKMYYPAFYFNPGAKRRALRVFALASKNKNEAMKSAMIFMNNYNGRISLLQENKYINPDYADVYVSSYTDEQPKAKLDDGKIPFVREGETLVAA